MPIFQRLNCWPSQLAQSMSVQEEEEIRIRAVFAVPTRSSASHSQAGAVTPARQVTSGLVVGYHECGYHVSLGRRLRPQHTHIPTVSF